MSNIHTLNDLRNNPSGTRAGRPNYQPGRAYAQSNSLDAYNADNSFTHPVYAQQQRQINNNNQSNKPKWYDYLFPKFNLKTFTFFITVVDIIIFIITKIYQASSGNNFTCVLYKFGAKYTPAIAINYQWHRVLIPIVLHGGWAHIIFNMLSQIMIGFVLEDYVGLRRFILLYIGAGIGGNMMSCVLYPHDISVGASSSLYGLFALQFAYLIQYYNQLGPRKNMLIMIWIVILVINFTTIPDGSNIDIGAHFGGFICGTLFSVMYFKKPEFPRFRLVKLIAGFALFSYYLGMILGIALYKGLELWITWINTYCA